ncbi:MAG: hypothetical protein ACOYLS_08340 [Polymorphobacter sp.]
MAWLAFEHLRLSVFALPANPQLIGIDRNLLFALLCGLASAALLISWSQRFVCLTIILGISYMLSARQLAGTLDLDALSYAPLVLAALYVWWPQLIVRHQPE